MKRVIYALLLAIAILLASCSQTQIPVSIPSIIRIDSLNNAKHYQLELLTHGLTCGCSLAYDTLPRLFDFHYWEHLSGEDSIEFENEFKAYAHDSMRNKVKAIGFSGMNTIPTRCKIFKNVESIDFFGVGHENGENIKLKGLELFPKLKRLYFFGSTINIDSTDQWIQQIEQISMGKCQANDFPSFDRWTNLKILTMHHSGFNPFPRNINSLTCLQKIMIAEYRAKNSGILDLKQFDFRYFPCMRYASFDGGTSGIPKRLDSKRHYRLEMRKWGITEEERKKIDPWIQHFN